MQAKNIGKRPKSFTRYPKFMSTCVVSLEVQKTDDDINTAQCHKKCPEASINSVTPTLSSKTITLDPTNVIDRNLNIKENIDETKIVIEDDNLCSDTENYPHDTTNNEVENNIRIDHYNKQPEIVFNTTNFRENYKNNVKYEYIFSKKKSKQFKRLFENKYKNHRNNKTTKLKNYYSKTKKKCLCTQLKKGSKLKVLNSNSITNIVSKSRLLKKVLAKEKLLNSDQALFSDVISLNENEGGSLTSSPSTAKGSFFSYSSQNTLIDTFSTKNNYSNFEAVNSHIQITSDNRTPYKMDSLNVAVAVTYNEPNVFNKEQSIENGDIKEKILYEESLNNANNIAQPHNGLTSQNISILSQNDNENYFTVTNLITSKTSDKTLIGIQNTSKLNLSDDDTYVISNTSLDFYKSSLNSDYTLTTKSEIIHFVPPSFIDISAKDPSNKVTLLDAVINMGLFPDIKPSTSSVSHCTEKLNNVIITDLQNKLPLSRSLKNKGDQPNNIKKIMSKNLLKKTYDSEKEIGINKNINLPNEATVKHILQTQDDKQRNNDLKSSHPTNIHELWDRLVIILDFTVKKLEDTLSEKIIKELIKIMPLFEKLSHPIPNVSIQTDSIHVFTEKIEAVEEVSIRKDKIDTIDESLQCDIVKNRVIDNLMLRLSIESAKPTCLETTSETIKTLKSPELIKDYLEILKPPIKDSLIETSKDETITISTEEPGVHSMEFSRLQHLKLIFNGPINFVRENWLVISSVPTFFALMLCIYSIIVFLVKPW
ncbi:uncharacterized protein LOC113520461 [Galleria mellonella]|uniref:Uncharacterized protein LOC113520461 n=1 Tax=Galleria mellonella TaxID=7137 RepID=A0A6J3C081_GALME|nr:uncharacterized protein LOC113520461 [Galleria mellonella]